MRILKFAFLFAGVVVLTWIFGFGGLSDVTRWVVTEQRDTQNALAAGLRAVRTGETGAWLALMSICAAYGFFHAVGPGHGKLVIGGLGFATGMTALRLSLLAVAASLAQATVAIVLVVIGAFVLGWGLTEMTALTEEIMAPASYAAIGLVGLWLVFRGVRRGTSTLVYPMDSDRHCDNCGHAHGPSLHQVEKYDFLVGCAGHRGFNCNSTMYWCSIFTDLMFWIWYTLGRNSGHFCNGSRHCQCNVILCSNCGHSTAHSASKLVWGKGHKDYGGN